MAILALLGTLLYVVGAIFSLIFTIIILIQAFKTSVGWGLVALLVPFGILVYIFKFWDQTKGPFFKILIGVAMMILGALVGLLAAGAGAAAA